MIRLAVRVGLEDSEIVLAELLELAPGGVEEVRLGEETVEYAVYGAPGELPELPDLDAAVGDTPVEVSSTEIADDWSERWKRFHRPVLIESPRGSPARSGSDEGGRVAALHVRPPWEAPSDRGDAEEIVIDPGQAFGTGAHATTRLCLELLLELRALQERPGSLLDVGTGSGVLAIAAARLGFAPVLGLDHERESVAAARENAEANGVAIDVRRFDLRAQALPWLDAADGPAGSLVVTANLLRPLLLDLAREMPRAPAHLLAGGLLKEQVDEVAQAFAERLGLRERERRERGEWAVLWLVGDGAGG
ncbi:MAG TPA: 50S ribosomal protein L11 methyltransferase [Solirubrobacteraceae bacterium]|nr:50S ribosomal protein L11 methyltransferase [Solirubrobacteraceae bacterium]